MLVAFQADEVSRNVIKPLAGPDMFAAVVVNANKEGVESNASETGDDILRMLVE